MTSSSSTRHPRGKRGSLRLALEPRLVIESAARAAYPDEACGVLMGTRDGDVTVAGFATVARNLEAEPAGMGRAGERFVLDPAALIKAERLAEAAGLEVLGIWHTHPDHEARPSRADREGAWEGWFYVIVPVDQRVPGAARAWALAGDDFVEIELRV